MENLRSIMQSLDDISKLIPEGTYLEMCDNLKMVHDQIPRKMDPPVRDNRRPPFQVIQGGEVEVLRLLNEDSDSENEFDDDAEPCTIPVEEFQNALKQWKELIGGEIAKDNTTAN